MYKKKTLRHMQPLTRRYARVVNDLDGVLRRLRNLKDEIARLELDSSALHNRERYERERDKDNLDKHMRDYFQSQQEEDHDEL